MTENFATRMARLAIVGIVLLVLGLHQQAFAQDELTSPAVLNAPVHYPESAVAAREQGTTIVKALVQTDGRASRAMIEDSSGFADLDAAAVRSIERWSFKPGMRNGKPEARWVRVPVAFQLNMLPLAEEAVVTSPEIRAVASVLVGYLGVTLWLVGFVWSLVLAKRRSIAWLSGMVALWAITYPIFVATHWAASRRNLIVVIAGLVFIVAGLLLAPVRH